MHWNFGNLLLCTGMLVICCYVLEFWQFVVMYWNFGNLFLCTGNLAIPGQNGRKQILRCWFNFCNILYEFDIWRICHGFPALYVHLFPRYIISVFHNSVKAVLLATLWTQHLPTVQYKYVSSQQFRATQRTENQCVAFCDYS
jgi:hypothetical protein